MAVSSIEGEWKVDQSGEIQHGCVFYWAMIGSEWKVDQSGEIQHGCVSY